MDLWVGECACVRLCLSLFRSPPLKNQLTSTRIEPVATLKHKHATYRYTKVGDSYKR